MKDRAVLNMIEDAEKQGLIKSGASTYVALQIAKSLGKGKKYYQSYRIRENDI